MSVKHQLVVLLTRCVQTSENRLFIKCVLLFSIISNSLPLNLLVFVHASAAGWWVCPDTSCRTRNSIDNATCNNCGLVQNKRSGKTSLKSSPQMALTCCFAFGQLFTVQSLLELAKKFATPYNGFAGQNLLHFPSNLLEVASTQLGKFSTP